MYITDLLFAGALRAVSSGGERHTASLLKDTHICPLFLFVRHQSLLPVCFWEGLIGDVELSATKDSYRSSSTAHCL